MMASTLSRPILVGIYKSDDANPEKARSQLVPGLPRSLSLQKVLLGYLRFLL